MIAEYCIGGPLHGQRQDNVEATRRGVLFTLTLDGRVDYYPRMVSLFGTPITVWVYQGMTASEAGPLLAEVLLAPHRVVDEPEAEPSPLTAVDRAWIAEQLRFGESGA